MISKEEIDILIKEDMNENVFDILVQDCCQIIKEKLEYKKEYYDIEDLFFLLVRLYYLDIDYKEIVLSIYELVKKIKINDVEELYNLYNKNIELNNINFKLNVCNLAQELKKLLSLEKNEFARMMIEENYYNRVFGNTLKRHNIDFENEDSFADLSVKVYKIDKSYLDKIGGILYESDELRKIDLLLDYSDDFSNRKIIVYNREEFEDLTEDWLFEMVYKKLKNCFINKFLQMLNKESEEEDLDKLLNELCVEVYMERSDISKECMEINKRINNTFATNDERNVENIYRLLDLYEFILDK